MRWFPLKTDCFLCVDVPTVLTQKLFTSSLMEFCFYGHFWTTCVGYILIVTCGLWATDVGSSAVNCILILYV